MDNKISRLSKQVFFQRYADLVRQLPNIRTMRNITADYGEVKLTVRDYQVRSKKQMLLIFKFYEL